MDIPMMQRAEQKSNEMGTINNSIMGGQRNFVGFLGEEVAISAMGGVSDNTYDYDMYDKYGYKVDVKTKLTTVEPKPYYDCSIAAYNTKQKCDYYAFVRIKKDLSCAWLLGIKDKQDYFDQSVFMRKGQIDPSNNFRVRADCYNLKIQALDDLKEQ